MYVEDQQQQLFCGFVIGDFYYCNYIWSICLYLFRIEQIGFKCLFLTDWRVEHDRLGASGWYLIWSLALPDVKSTKLIRKDSMNMKQFAKEPSTSFMDQSLIGICMPLAGRIHLSLTSLVLASVVLLVL